MSVLGVFPLAAPAAMLVAALAAFAGRARPIARTAGICRSAGYIALMAALTTVVVLTTAGTMARISFATINLLRSDIVQTPVSVPITAIPADPRADCIPSGP